MRPEYYNLPAISSCGALGMELLSTWYMQLWLMLAVYFLIGFLVYRAIQRQRRRRRNLPPAVNLCPNCGRLLPPANKYCYRCGAPTNWWRI